MMATSARADAPLDGAWPTLAEVLRRRGYATAGFVGNIFYGSAHYGLDRGFSHYHDVRGNVTRRVTPRELARSCHLGATVLTWLERKWRILRPMQRERPDAWEIGKEALAWVDATRRAERPYFLFLNLFDAHSPYSPPPEAPIGFARVAPDRLDPMQARMRALEDRLWEKGDRSVEPELAGARAEFLRAMGDAYDDGLAWADRQLERFLEELRRRGLMENTLVVVTSDHGEMIGEHELVGHGQTLHRPVVHVPLIVMGPGAPAGATVDAPVSLADVPATVLELAGMPTPPLAGRSLSRFWDGEARGDEAVVSEAEGMPWQPRSRRMPVAYGPMWLVTRGRFAYHRHDHETLGRIERLHDLEADPGEATDLAARSDHATTLSELRGVLKEWLERR
jgi:arylsulfatase A-like enzyme